jgi:hypothetical protein
MLTKDLKYVGLKRLEFDVSRISFKNVKKCSSESVLHKETRLCAVKIFTKFGCGTARHSWKTPLIMNVTHLMTSLRTKNGS